MTSHEAAAGNPTPAPQTQPPAPPLTGAGTEPASAPPSLPGRHKILIVGAAAAFALLLTTIGVVAARGSDGSGGTAPEQVSPFIAAREKCGTSAPGISAPGDVELGDEGRTLTLHGMGEESTGLSYDRLECYWSALGMPDSIKAEVGATRALDGRQSGSWGDIRASWSYHPDSGLHMVLTINR